MFKQIKKIFGIKNEDVNFFIPKIKDTYILSTKFARHDSLLSTFNVVKNNPNKTLDKYIIGIVDSNGFFIPVENTTSCGFSPYPIYDKPSDYTLKQFIKPERIDFEFFGYPTIYEKYEAVKIVRDVRDKFYPTIFKIVSYNEWVNKTHIVTYPLYR